MNILLIIVVVYFALGVISLLVLEVTTHRISKRLKAASVEAQVKLSDNGQFIGSKTAILMTFMALFLFYPAAVYAAIRWR